ncbi:restriction endonuclease S subunit [Sulfuricaulis limicola]|uniref:Restriction endonuclease S subunit n=1 Tax=Sulfuricaulis limicola TaxID=1620215 RepID=A0A1B4XF17_9GAMM|nr:hypothetical protein [Sulfuricaulis limicola]BAV33392.1 restriction endonuclease S subunit [Sulfuricaulis limicola]
MIVDFKPYPAMKDSGLPWLGEVPEHWDIKRAKNLFRCVDVRSEIGEHLVEYAEKLAKPRVVETSGTNLAQEENGTENQKGHIAVAP